VKAMGVYLQIEEYHHLQDISQAVEILSRFVKKAKVIAGGTDILPQRSGVKKNGLLVVGAVCNRD
jgi:CO/xanthine dehydrogenase FAD-binding subunit